jgi:hypothetical protein
MGVRVAAESRIGFIQRHPVPPGQDVGGGKAGHSTADYRYRTGVLIHNLYSEPPTWRTGCYVLTGVLAESERKHLQAFADLQ